MQHQRNDFYYMDFTINECPHYVKRVKFTIFTNLIYSERDKKEKNLVTKPSLVSINCLTMNETIKNSKITFGWGAKVIVSNRLNVLFIVFFQFSHGIHYNIVGDMANKCNCAKIRYNCSLNVTCH